MSKVALITGSSRGIGRETALVLGKAGYSVVINYHNSESKALSLLNEMRNQGIDCIALQCNVSDSISVNEMTGHILKNYGHIDVLVNNAGVADYKILTDVTDEDYERIFDVNVKGTFNTIRAILPSMISRKSGKIINISSIWGIAGASCEVIYSASKAAIIGLTKALAKEVGQSGITVNCVAPGVISTDMTKNLNKDDINTLLEQTPLNRIGKPIDIANVIKFLVSDEADFITGQVISSNGGFVI